MTDVELFTQAWIQAEWALVCPVIVIMTMGYLIPRLCREIRLWAVMVRFRFYYWLGNRREIARIRAIERQRMCRS